MSFSQRLRPVLLSALVLACAREAVRGDLVTDYVALFNDHVAITVPGYSGGTAKQSNFPLLVRVSEDNPKGFTYSRVDGSGKDIRFLYSAGGEDPVSVPCEVDTWNTNGVSALWVRLPTLNNNAATTLTMYWAPDDPDRIPANVPNSVWSGYSAVWHMNGVADSSPNDVAATKGPKASSRAGVIGSALGTRDSGANGPVMTVPSGTVIDAMVSGSYTVTCWMRAETLAGSPWLYSARMTPTDDAFGVALLSDSGVRLTLHSDASASDTSTKSFSTGEWVHLAIVHEGASGRHRVYRNGVEFYYPTANRTDKPGSGGLAFGGLVGSSASGTLNGDLDDVRVWPGELSRSWCTNEYAQAVSTGYLAFGEVSSTDEPVYEDEKEKSGGGSSPDPAADASPADYAGTATFVPAGAEEGVVLTNFVTLVKVWENEPSGFVPADLPFGTEDLRFFDDEGNVLQYDIDQWDAENECHLWLRVPRLSRSTRITMCWGLREGKKLPAVDASAVWSDYAGVWHMTDARDSTANGATGALGANAVSIAGLAGKASGTKKTGQNGAILDIAANAAIEDLSDGPFTVSGWVYLNNTATAYGALFSRSSSASSAWGARFCGTSGNSSKLEIQTGASGVQISTASKIPAGKWVKFDVCYSSTQLALYLDGAFAGKSDTAQTISSGASGGLSVGGFVAAAEDALGINTLNGYVDEFRLRAGAPSVAEMAADAAQCGSDGFYERQAAKWDEAAVLQNRWKTVPTASKTVWRQGEAPADFTLGEPWYGESSLSYLDRSTGEILSEMPTGYGDYRAVFTVPASGRYSSLEKTIDFRILLYQPTHDLGGGNDRVLLLNSDTSVSDGEVRAQSYSDTESGLERPYWVHDVDSGSDYTSTSPYFNFCGGLRHTYYSADGVRLWDLLDVRYGNTYHNADQVFRKEGRWELWDEGLEEGLNYLPWNPEGGCLVDEMGLPAEGWHEYAAQAVLCNSTNASVNSTLYTNGIGTIYFDCVNSHADDATNGYYRLVLEIATNAISRVTGRPVGVPTDENIAATRDVWDAERGEWVEVVDDPYRYADWKRVPVVVRLVSGETMAEPVTNEVLNLGMTHGGSYTNFYRAYAPVNVFGKVRFRIRRISHNPGYAIAKDSRSMILVDNVICSAPTDRVVVEPRGIYEKAKVSRETVGCEGAFAPSYPAVGDGEVFARVRTKSLATGAAVPSGAVSSILMHYRWRYIDQQCTDWATVDVEPATLTGRRPLEWPGVPGDLEYWYETSQSVGFYQYADYSGAGLGLPGYTEEITGVVSRAPTYETDGKDWFTRIRDGKSTYATILLHVRKGASAPVETVAMFLARDRVWRGCVLATNAVAEGLYFRFEGRNSQDDALADFQFNTNFWYLAESGQELPVSGSVVAGTADDWGHVPCDGATGHVMFQLDETTRALTVVHADWQDFNGWNDAYHSYFSGSSTDDVTKRGVSAAQRESVCLASGWNEDNATNEYWIERFAPSFYSGYDFYKPFLAANSPNGFGVGEGMWVCGAYADRSVLSGMALQMAGQGRGYVQLPNRKGGNPRGLESVSFSARIAQAVSPGDFAYSESDLTLGDYSFLTRAAFDLCGNSNFTGNASLSLAAFYRPQTSCYEARWEQIGGDFEKESGKILGPSERGQRLALFRWDFVGAEWKSTELIAATNSVAESSWYAGCLPQAIPAAFSITNGLMPFMIGACNNEDEDYTVVVAAVHIPGVADKEMNVAGNRADSTMKFLGEERGWLYLVYRDTGANRLKRGTYGVLAANCEGVFVRPQLHAGLVSWEGQAKTRTLDTQVWPTAVSAGEVAEFFNHDFAYECVADLAEDYWIVPDGRVQSFYEAAASGYTDYNGFRSTSVTQTVDVYTAPFGSADWTKVASRTLTGFGKPGVQQDSVLDFWSTDDRAVRIQPGGTINDLRTDVVVDNIQITQWAGTNWLGRTAAERADCGPTNFVYTYGWVSDGALQLSPRRTPDGKPCSLRAPLCDDKGSEEAKRGIGLGSITVWYRNAQPNARLLVQIATNGVSQLRLESLTLDNGTDPRTWTTVTNWDFSALPPSGTLVCAPGLHGVVGTMRVIVDPTLRAEVKGETDPDHFGSVEITKAIFRDEPPLDKGCWWGFNIRTLGDASDSEQRMYLPDCPYRSFSQDPIGLSLALNNSITADCDPSEVGKEPNPFRAHMPFLQTPTFASNIVGEVSFKARKYALQKGSKCAQITLYGTREAKFEDLQDKDWEILNVFLVSNTTYETYRYKTDGNATYRAFRFAVTGVEGVAFPGDEPVSGGDPVRVLLDDVLVSEAVRARLAFRNVGAFRSDITGTAYVPNVPSVDEQPLAGEGWGVQAEIYAAMLGDEIDSETPPRVRLHYIPKKGPWGYRNWKDSEDAKGGWLTRATDTNSFFRSSTVDSSDTVIPMTSVPNSVVQYTLEVVYAVINPETGNRSEATNWLESADWTVPSWYSPVDYNADPDYGKGLEANFSAFTILDEVAPGWAWINEANVFGSVVNLENTDDNRQFVEIAKPAEYGLENWRLEMLSYKSGNTDPATALITTNVLATFGMGNVSSTKTTKHASDNMTFMVVGCPNSENKTLYRSSTDDKKDETLDGTWSFQTTDGTTCKSDGTIGYYSPIGLRLVRPSGIVEHEIVCIGTNRYASSPYMRKRYDPTNLVNRLNAVDASGRFFFAGSDDGGSERSLGVYDSRGEASNWWNRVQTLTPGRINAGQTINPVHPTPGGELVMVYASVDTAIGHVVQTVGTATNTTALQVIAVRRGNETGTNITYTVDPWYELGTVRETEDGKTRTPGWEKAGRQYTVNVAKGATKSVTVVATAAVDRRLREDFGLNGNNRYTSAVMRWLEGGRTLSENGRDGAFYDADSGEIHLAQFLALSGKVVTNMTLTQMYWLDMDPTASNMFFRAGMVKPPSTVVWKDPTYAPETDPQAHTNLRMGVYMSISNGNGHASHKGKSYWAPYVLRGLAPGELSWNYYPESASAWTSVTFKVTGFLVNALNRESDPSAWVPLRYFVFDDRSFDDACEAEIDIEDPFTTSSLGYYYGWYDWAIKEGKKPPVWFSWNIDQRLVPVTAETLAPTNRLVGTTP